MTIICQPIDASAGVPSYTAQASRQAFSSLMMNGTARPLGAVSGIRPGAGGETTIVGSNVTVQPFSAVLDPAFTTAQAPYQVASNAAEVRAINAAHATLPRVDILYLQVSDTAIDSSGGRAASLLYLAGTAAGSPVKPALPARSVEWATVSVPASGGGAATVTRTVGYAVASGGTLPVASSAAYPATPHVGQQVFDLALGYELVWSGTLWVPSAGHRGLQSGSVPVSFTATNVATGNVVFAPAASAAPAIVLVTDRPITNSRNVQTNVLNTPSATGFSWRCQVTDNGVISSGTASFWWLAVWL